MGVLYIIATPIGNREDITIRALKTLFSIDVLLCEDTRKAGLLLNYYRTTEPYSGIIRVLSHQHKPRFLSYYDQIEEERVAEVLAFLEQGRTVGLVTDAGTPLISDPGFKLVRECRRRGIPVSPIPGPSSLTAALSVAGVPTDRFIFLGYAPRKSSELSRLLRELKKCGEILKFKTVIFLESPARISKTVALLEEIAPTESIIIARELTKLHESIEKAKHVSGEDRELIRGECVVCVDLSF